MSADWVVKANSGVKNSWSSYAKCYAATVDSNERVKVNGVDVGPASDLMITTYNDSFYVIGKESGDASGTIFMNYDGSLGTRIYSGVTPVKDEVISYMVLSNTEMTSSVSGVNVQSNVYYQDVPEQESSWISTAKQTTDDIIMNLIKAMDTGEDWIEKTFASEKDSVLSFFSKAPTAVSNFISTYFSVSGNNGSNALIGRALKDINSVVNAAATVANYTADMTNTVAGSISGVISEWASYIGTGTNFGAAIQSGLKVFSAALVKYQNGVDEMPFGEVQESSWYQSSTSFLNTFKSGSGRIYKVSVLSSTPLDPGTDRSSMYGSMMLGVPPLFNSLADPGNRAMAETFLRDARFLSLTPGMPKYNGSAYTQIGTTNGQATTLSDGDEMLAYLSRNGLDSGFASKDKRYYVFEAKYEDYFAYLETMLNTLWIKMGLGSKGDNEIDIMSFFGIKSDSGMSPDGYKTLLSKYSSSIGFYVNPNGGITESVANSQTDTGSELASTANANSDAYQKINYLTGMGTGGSVKNASRTLANTYQTAVGMQNFLSDTFTNMKAGFNSSGNTIVRLVKAAIGAAKDVVKLNTQEDFGAYIQSFATTNGMRVMFPELWRDSSYSKAINMNFNFVSPYGDPLSIFQYVYVPFAALLCFTLPRQADSNGYVSPFFVRADIPGLITSDLALISDMSWTRGGDQGLFTKDGLPRAISGTFTIYDLYPYLAMTKRLSYLSANPSYTVFLDGMAGLHALAKDDSEAALSDYWKQMINRVSGQDNGAVSNGLWNSYDSDRMKTNAEFLSSTKQSNLIKIKTSSVNWMRKGY